MFYTSVKDKRTHDKLYKYIVHKLYDFHFNLAANVVDRDSIFIPFGWDNAAKMNILLENSATIKSDSPYADVIARPTTRKPMQRDTDVVMAQDDQEFLAKLQILLNKVSPSTPSTKTVHFRFLLFLIFILHGKSNNNNQKLFYVRNKRMRQVARRSHRA